MERREMPFGYVSEMLAGSFAEPYSFLQSAEGAQDIGSRLMSNREYQSAINYLEKQLKIEELSSFYGNNFGSPGYAGARTMTGTIIERDGTVTDVDGVGKDFYGPKRYHGRWLADLIDSTKQIQEEGQEEGEGGIAYIKEFDEDTGMPISVSKEPNPKYHDAVFYISPSVEEIGVVVRGIHHSVGEPSAKYNFAIFPLDYKDIMLGHRTVSDTDRAKLEALCVSGAIIYELADKVRRGKTSLGEGVKEIASHISKNKMSRRAFNSSLALLSFYLASCGGGNGNSPSPPQPPEPPQPQTFEYSGSLLKRVANDGSKVGQGTVKLEGTPGNFIGDIDSEGNFKITGIKAGSYKRITGDTAGDLVYVPQVESIVQINGNLTGQKYSVIDRGDNRCSTPFDDNFQAFYRELAQRLLSVGVFERGNISGQEPSKIRSAASTIPDDVKSLFMDSVNFLNNRDTPIFSGERLVSLPAEFGEIASDYEIEMSMHEAPTGATNPLTDGKRMIRARVLFDSIMADHLRQGIDRTCTISHEYGHCYGAADFKDAIFKSIMNNIPRMSLNEPSINDELAFYIFNHSDVHPGNIFPDVNP